jgi:hypothetical protein
MVAGGCDALFMRPRRVIRSPDRHQTPEIIAAVVEMKRPE